MQQIFEEDAGYHCLTRIDHHTTDLYLYSCGSQKCPSGYSWGPASRPEYHLHVILDGCGSFEIVGGGVTYHLKRGQMFLCPPDTKVYYRADEDSPWYYAWISFHGTKAVSFLRSAGFDGSGLIRSCNIPPEKFAFLIHQMLGASQPTSVGELKRLGYLYRFFSLLVDSNNPSSDSFAVPYDTSSDTYIEHALQYISVNYNTQIHIADIASYIGVHRSYLYNLFKEKLQQSPQEYLLAFRIERAKKLLVSSSEPVKEIAKQVGYQNAFAFSKAFHRITGVSPSEYRSSTPPEIL